MANAWPKRATTPEAGGQAPTCRSCKEAWAWAFPLTGWRAAWRHRVAWAAVNVDLRRRHPDLMASTRGLPMDAAHLPETKAAIGWPAWRPSDAKVRSARRWRWPRLVAINVMRARQGPTPAASSGPWNAAWTRWSSAPAAAGICLAWPRITPDVALIPILSDARGVQLVVKKWERKKRLPDAIVLEHPVWQGGHLGAIKIADLGRQPLRLRAGHPGCPGLLPLSRHRARHPLIAAGASAPGGHPACPERWAPAPCSWARLRGDRKKATRRRASRKCWRAQATDDMVEFTSVVTGFPPAP